MALTDGLVAYYNCDETAGTTAEDSLNAHDGTITGATINQAGHLGRAYLFEGSPDVVNCGAFALGVNSGSINIWVNSDTTTDYVAAIGKYYNQHSIIIRNTGYWTAVWNNTTVFGSVAVNTSAFQMVTVTYDGSLGTNNLKIFVNGTNVGQENLTGNNTHDADDWGIGSDNLASSYFSGIIDEVGFWNRALTSAEVTSLYNGGTGLTYPFTSYVFAGVLYVWSGSAWIPRPLAVDNTGFITRPTWFWEGTEWKLTQSF